MFEITTCTLDYTNSAYYGQEIRLSSFTFHSVYEFLDKYSKGETAGHIQSTAYLTWDGQARTIQAICEELKGLEKLRYGKIKTIKWGELSASMFVIEECYSRIRRIGVAGRPYTAEELEDFNSD
jgi:hypothetical protein